MSIESYTLHHRAGSSLAGVRREYTQDVVHLGRLPENEVAFDPSEDLLVSGRHAEIRRCGGGLELIDLDSRNGSFVNGVRVQGPMMLAPRDVIRLGHDGPEMSVQFIDSAEILQTLAGAPEPGTAASTFAGPPRTMEVESPGPTPVVRVQGAQPGEPDVKEAVGVQTLMRVVGGAVSDERSRLMKIVVPIAAVLIAAVGVLAFRLRGTHAAWSASLATAHESVYVCLKVRTLDDGREILSPFGTAWAVAPGKLATNAHVADAFNELDPNESIVVRDTSTVPQDLKVESVTIHPGYAACGDLWGRYRPFDPATEDFWATTVAFDVALLNLNEEDATKMKPALLLAADEELFALAPGDPIRMIGYPMENQAGGGLDLDHPVPREVSGSLTRVADFFFSKANPRDRYSLACALQSAGGASGSPLFNSDGQVIGLNSAGDYQSLLGVRIRSGGAYGQRVDLLNELLDGAADDLLAGHLGPIEERLKGKFQAGLNIPELLGLRVIGSELANNDSVKKLMRDLKLKGEPVIVGKGKLRLETQAEAGRATADEELRAAVSGLYIVFVCATQAPVSPTLLVQRNGGAFNQASDTNTYYNYKILRASKGERLGLAIQVSDGGESFEPTDYHYYWFRIQ